MACNLLPPGETLAPMLRRARVTRVEIVLARALDPISRDMIEAPAGTADSLMMLGVDDLGDHLPLHACALADAETMADAARAAVLALAAAWHDFKPTTN